MSERERIARIIEPGIWWTLEDARRRIEEIDLVFGRTDGSDAEERAQEAFDYWAQQRATARKKADAILALQKDPNHV